MIEWKSVIGAACVSEAGVNESAGKRRLIWKHVVVWWSTTDAITQRHQNGELHLHLCGAWSCSRGGDLCPQQWLGITAPRPETHRARIPASAFSCHIWAEKTASERRRDRQREGEAWLALIVDPRPPPASLPTVISLTGLFICRDPCSFSSPSLSLLFIFSYLYEEVKRQRRGGGKVVWLECEKEGESGTAVSVKAERWSFHLLRVSLTSLQLSGGLREPTSLTSRLFSRAEFVVMHFVVLWSSWNCSHSAITWISRLLFLSK